MKCYVYDSTLIGVYTSAYYALKNKERPKIYSKLNYQPTFLLEHVEIESDENLYKKVKNALIKRI